MTRDQTNSYDAEIALRREQHRRERLRAKKTRRIRVFLFILMAVLVVIF